MKLPHIREHVQGAYHASKINDKTFVDFRSFITQTFPTTSAFGPLRCASVESRPSWRRKYPDGPYITCSFKVAKDYDFLCDLALVADSPMSVVHIWLETGPTDADSFDFYTPEDVLTMARCCATLVGDRRPVTTTCIPLCMAGFYPHNAMPYLEHHEIKVFVTSRTPLDNARLVGRRYALEKPLSFLLFNTEQLTYRNMNNGPETIGPGVTQVRLSWNHVTHALFLWGFQDRSLVKRLALTLDGQELFDCTLAELDLDAAANGFSLCKPADPIVVLFSRAPLVREDRGGINFTVVERPFLSITAPDCPPSTKVNVCGVFAEPIKTWDGLSGLKWTG